MGKNKSKMKNVFKVAGPRSQRAKAKAKKVKTTLKKVSVPDIIHGTNLLAVNYLFFNIMGMFICLAGSWTGK
jgi:hypothetical protein